MGLFGKKKKEKTTSCCCGGNCTPENMAKAELQTPSARSSEMRRSALRSLTVFHTQTPSVL